MKHIHCQGGEHRTQAQHCPGKFKVSPLHKPLLSTANKVLATLFLLSFAKLEHTIFTAVSKQSSYTQMDIRR